MSFRTQTWSSATIAAYRIEGLRRSDFKIVLKAMLEQFSNEAGAQQKRPSSLKWAYWVRLAGKSVRGEARAKAQLGERKSAHQIALTSKRRQSVRV